jgi:hypothetical protein
MTCWAKSAIGMGQGARLRVVMHGAGQVQAASGVNAQIAIGRGRRK